MEEWSSNMEQVREDLARVRALRKGLPCIRVNTEFVVVKLGHNLYRLGALYGDWLMQGTAEQVTRRAYQRRTAEQEA